MIIDHDTDDDHDTYDDYNTDDNDADARSLPWKLLLQILKVFLVTAQLWIFASGFRHSPKIIYIARPFNVLRNAPYDEISSTLKTFSLSRKP